MEVIISKSKKPDKKYDARIDGTKTISFGQKMASDYTKHKDPIRKERYIARHKKMKIGMNQVQKLRVSGLGIFCGRSLL